MSPEPSLCVLVDTREQNPYRYPGDRVVTLDCADYSGSEVQDVLRIERKSLPDFLGCVGKGRERFERSLERMTAFPLRYLVLEFTLSDLVNHVWKTWHLGPAGTRRTTRQIKVHPNSAVGSVFRWSQKFQVQPIFCGGWMGEGRRMGMATTRKLVELATRQKERAGALS